jgi:hypothetical protein
VNGIDLLVLVLAVAVGIRGGCLAHAAGASRLVAILVGVIAGLGAQTMFYMVAGTIVATSSHNYYGSWRH